MFPLYVPIIIEIGWFSIRFVTVIQLSIRDRLRHRNDLQLHLQGGQSVHQTLSLPVPQSINIGAVSGSSLISDAISYIIFALRLSRSG